MIIPHLIIFGMFVTLDKDALNRRTRRVFERSLRPETAPIGRAGVIGGASHEGDP
jgi:hypothetical protein